MGRHLAAKVALVLCLVFVGLASAECKSQLTARQQWATSPLASWKLRSLKKITTSMHGLFWSAKWSRDGEKIAFMCNDLQIPYASGGGSWTLMAVSPSGCGGPKHANTPR